MSSPGSSRLGFIVAVVPPVLTTIAQLPGTGKWSSDIFSYFLFLGDPIDVIATLLFRLWSIQKGTHDLILAASKQSTFLSAKSSNSARIDHEILILGKGDSFLYLNAITAALGDFGVPEPYEFLRRYL
jgi:hypothetical protein